MISFKALPQSATFEARATKLPARVLVVPWSEGEAYREVLANAKTDADYVGAVCALLSAYVVAMPEIDEDAYPAEPDPRAAWWRRNFSFSELVAFGTEVHLGRASEGKA